MIAGARFGHTHLIAHDWRAISRDFEDPDLERGTGIAGAALRGEHLRHIAFVVDDVAAAREAVLAAGDRSFGEVATLINALGKKLTGVYVTDPEAATNRKQT